MGTRGLMAFAVDGKTVGTYNHFDSYPAWLGERMLTWVRENVVTEKHDYAEAVRRLTLVDEMGNPSAEQAAALSASWDKNVSTGENWYSVLRNNQGDPEATLASGFMVDGTEFASESLWCEWGYVVDFDTRTFEVYEGFQRAPHSDGRFADFPNDGEYYPIRLIASYSFDNLPDDLSGLEEDEDE